MCNRNGKQIGTGKHKDQFEVSIFRRWDQVNQQARKKWRKKENYQFYCHVFIAKMKKLICELPQIRRLNLLNYSLKCDKY